MLAPYRRQPPVSRPTIIDAPVPQAPPRRFFVMGVLAASCWSGRIGLIRPDVTRSMHPGCVGFDRRPPTRARAVSSVSPCRELSCFQKLESWPLASAFLFGTRARSSLLCYCVELLCEYCVRSRP
jgi:hypothetical protein